MKQCTLYFHCGCFIVYYVDGSELKGGLACCKLHEAAYQKLEKIVPLVLIKVKWDEGETTKK